MTISLHTVRAAIGVRAADADNIRVYFQQIGSIPLLKSHEERALCERIEAAQHSLAAVLLAVPWAARRLVELAAAAARGCVATCRAEKSPAPRIIPDHSSPASISARFPGAFTPIRLDLDERASHVRGIGLAHQ